MANGKGNQYLCLLLTHIFEVPWNTFTALTIFPKRWMHPLTLTPPPPSSSYWIFASRLFYRKVALCSAVALNHTVQYVSLHSLILNPWQALGVGGTGEPAPSLSTELFGTDSICLNVWRTVWIPPRNVVPMPWLHSKGFGLDIISSQKRSAHINLLWETPVVFGVIW